MIPNNFDNRATKVLNHLGISNPVLIGKGDQSWVYRYRPGVVAKVHRRSNKQYLESLMELEKVIKTHKLPFSTPEIMEIGLFEDTYYNLEKELSGTTLGNIWFSLSNTSKKNAVDDFVVAIKYLSEITLEDYPFGQVLVTGEHLTAGSWREFIDHKLIQRINLVRDKLETDVKNLDEKINIARRAFHDSLDFNEKCLVHGDYFYNNVLYDQKNRLSAVIDFSNSTVIGDFRMDLACAIMYFDLEEAWNKKLRDLVKKNHGQEIDTIIDLYTVYQAFFQTESYYYNQGLYKWCLGHLNSDVLWDKIKQIVK
jgi:aminoglycoside phosphotransferase (APT) family kinase protein